jgi:O-antigen chain-terminating methyltransferase
METPNPENIVVGTSNFYVDPSHEKPIPPLLLSFLAEYAGFFQVKTLRLQESKGLRTKVQVNLEDVLTGVSPDYAIVAQKAAPQPVLELAAHAFEVDHGLDLSGLLNRWDARFENEMTKVKQAQDQAKEIAQQLQRQVQETLELGQLAQTAAEEVKAKAEQAQAAAIQAVNAAQHQAQELNALYASKSWRYTKPLRWIFEQTRRLKAEGPKERAKALVLKVHRRIDQELMHRPTFRLQLIGLSQKIGLHALLKKTQTQWREQPGNEPARSAATSPIEPLSPRAQIIYEDLKKAIGQHQEGA